MTAGSAPRTRRRVVPVKVGISTRKVAQRPASRDGDPAVAAARYANNFLMGGHVIDVVRCADKRGCFRLSAGSQTTLGAGVVLVEEHVRLAVEVADRASVLVHVDTYVTASAQDLVAHLGRLDHAFLGEDGALTGPVLIEILN